MIPRFEISFGMFTGGVLFVAWVMEKSGTASPKNPAWQIVSGLRIILLTLIAFAIIAYAWFVIRDYLDRSAEEAKEKKEWRELRLRSIEERLRLAERSMASKSHVQERLDKLEAATCRVVKPMLRRLDKLEANQSPELAMEQAAEKALVEFEGKSA